MSHLSYQPVGATLPNTKLSVPSNFRINHARRSIGQGPQCFENGRKAIFGKRMVDLDWMNLDGDVETNSQMLMRAKIWGTKWQLPLQVIEVYDTSIGQKRIAGFSYGTRSGHMLRGEERFCVEWDMTSNDVVYEIYSFCRPHRLLAYLGWPFIVLLQKRFLKQSLDAMERAVDQANNQR